MTFLIPEVMNTANGRLANNANPTARFDRQNRKTLAVPETEFGDCVNL
jgi:hypothetical protein